MQKLLLAGDVGGTKTALAVASLEPGTGGAPLAEALFDNRRYASLEAVVAEFLRAEGLSVELACFSVAGPVANGAATLSNLGWRIERNALCRAFGAADVLLVNDLQATAYAVPHLDGGHILTLQGGRPVAGGPQAVVAPGTGLGEAYLLWEGSHFEAFPSEGGNADFSPGDELQIELLRFLRRECEHVSVEMVCSGVGLPNVYRFLRESGIADEPTWLAEKLASVPDPTPVIIGAALQEADAPPICRQALRIFADVLAAEAGNMALRLLASGGVYLGGGIPPRILPVLREPRFVETFCRKGRFAPLLREMPLHVILEPRAALLGAIRYGLDARLQARTPIVIPSR